MYTFILNNWGRASIIRNIFPGGVLEADCALCLHFNIIEGLNNLFRIYCLEVYCAIAICQRPGQIHLKRIYHYYLNCILLDCEEQSQHNWGLKFLY